MHCDLPPAVACLRFAPTTMWRFLPKQHARDRRAVFRNICTHLESTLSPRTGASLPLLCASGQQAVRYAHLLTRHGALPTSCIVYRVGTAESACWTRTATETHAGPARRRGSARSAARPRWRRRRCAALRASTASTSPPCRAAGQAAACTRVRASARSRLGGCVRARLPLERSRPPCTQRLCFCVPLELRAPCTRTPKTAAASYQDCTCCAPGVLAYYQGGCQASQANAFTLAATPMRALRAKHALTTLMLL